MAAAPAQETIVQTQDGATLKVVSMDDGSLAVVTASGEVLTGEAAVQALTAAGVSIQISSLGTIMSLQGARIVQPVTAARVETRNLITPKVEQNTSDTTPSSRTAGSGEAELPGNASSMADAGSVQNQLSDSAQSNINTIVERVQEGKADPSVLPESVSK
jgi:hypothetical protein